MSAATAPCKTTRRTILGGGTLLLAAVPATAVGAATASAHNPRLARTIAVYNRAFACADRFDVNVMRPAQAACRAEIDAYVAEPEPPHEESVTSFENAFGERVRLSTSRSFKEIANRVVNDPTWADMGDEDWRQAHREIADAFDRRQKALGEQETRRTAFRDAVRTRHRIDALQERADTLSFRSADLWNAVVKTPAHSVHDIALKLAFVDRTKVDDPDFVLEAITADVRRLAGEA